MQEMRLESEREAKDFLERPEDVSLEWRCPVKSGEKNLN